MLDTHARGAGVAYTPIQPRGGTRGPPGTRAHATPTLRAYDTPRTAPQATRQWIATAPSSPRHKLKIATRLPPERTTMSPTRPLKCAAAAGAGVNQRVNACNTTSAPTHARYDRRSHRWFQLVYSHKQDNSAYEAHHTRARYANYPASYAGGAASALGGAASAGGGEGGGLPAGVPGLGGGTPSSSSPESLSSLDQRFGRSQRRSPPCPAELISSRQRRVAASNSSSPRPGLPSGGRAGPASPSSSSLRFRFIPAAIAETGTYKLSPF